jgi:hypothetical protein
LPFESLNSTEIFGLAGGASFMVETDEGEHLIKRNSDVFYIR